MKNYKAISVMVSAVLATGVASAETENNSGNINEQLSEVRASISAQVLQNKLFDAELEGLKKQQEIKKIKEELDGATIESASTVQKQEERDHTFKFDEELNNEDVLIENNNWEQNVGFIYQDDVDMSGGISNGSSSLSSLTGSSNNADDSKLTEFLTATLEGIDEDEVEDESPQTIESPAFQLTTIELNKLIVQGDYKSAEIKVGYITDNGFQKIRGAKVAKATEGKIFDVKGHVSFKVKSINENGVMLIDLRDESERLVSR